MTAPVILTPEDAADVEWRARLAAWTGGSLVDWVDVCRGVIEA